MGEDFDRLGLTEAVTVGLMETGVLRGLTTAEQLAMVNFAFGIAIGVLSPKVFEHGGFNPELFVGRLESAVLVGMKNRVW